MDSNEKSKNPKKTKSSKIETDQFRLLKDSEILFKAAINRLAARMTKKLVHSSEELTELAAEIPNKLQEEWSSFKNEVIEESERLEQEMQKTNTTKEKDTKKKSSKEDLIQFQIDELRAKVIEINKSIEEKN